jgi:hypothetical protein
MNAWMDGLEDGRISVTIRESRTRTGITGTKERMKRRKRRRVSVTRLLYKRKVILFLPVI